MGTTNKGDPLAYPCLALRRQAQEDGVAFALAWRGIGKRLWAAHGSTGSDWEEVDVTALATPPVTGVSRFCIAMDHALNTWLVFSAFDGEHQRIYLSVRPSGGTWSVPTVVSSTDDHTGERETLAFESVDFPSVAISADEDENGPTVLVVYVVSYSDGWKRVLGKAARVAEVEAADWSLASVAEVNVGHSAECRDPCVAATRSGTFVVAYSAPTSDAQNFASLSMDEATGRCFVCWEDTLYSVTRDAASANGAVAELSDLGTWSALGILTGRELPPEFDPAALPESVVTARIKEYATRYPCVVATAGSPRLFYTAFNGTHAELVSRVGRWI